LHDGNPQEVSLTADETEGHGSRDNELADQILEQTLDLAEEVGWENVRLRLVATRLDIPLSSVSAIYRDQDAVADAWFARARQALVSTPDPGVAEASPPERIHAHLMQWFDALAPRRKVTVQMLKLKMWPFHPHHFVPMVFNLSRTILWLRDAAGLDAHAPRREVEEVALTWLFLATLAIWSRDDTPGQERTREFLKKRLEDADRLYGSTVGRRG
jgi:AcrR family transcriptional regulator